MNDASHSGADERSAKLRSFFASYVCERAGVRHDSGIAAAFATMLREPFAGPGPWSISTVGPWRPRPDWPRYVRTPDDDPAFLYQDTLIALDAERGINIGEPSLHAYCLAALSLQPGETVLQVGAGSGYYTAILAQLVGPDGRVLAFEIDPWLAERAKRNLAAWPHAIVEERSGVSDGLPDADAIYVNAGITQPSWAWLDALRLGGRLLFPLQPEGGWGGMLLIEKPTAGGTSWPDRFICRAAFIACQARQDDETRRRLVAAFRNGGFEAVRSFRVSGSTDGTCWFDGGDWWLSTETP